MVSSEHEHHLQELGGVRRQAAAEPQKRHDTTNTNVLLEDFGNGDTRVQKLLTTIIRDSGNESSGLSDKTKLLGPRVVNGDLGDLGFRLGNDDLLLNQRLVDKSKSLREILKSVGDKEASSLHGSILGLGSLKVRVGHRTSVAELNLSLKHGGTSTNSPGNNRLLDRAVLDGLNDAVLFNTTNFTQENNDLTVGVSLISENVVNEGGTGVSVTTDSNTLVNTVGSVGNNVVKFVGHTTGLGYVGNRARSVELGSNNVVHHTTGVTDLEAARLNTTNGGRANNGDTLLLSLVKDLTGTALRNTLGNDSNSLNLRVLKELQGGGVDGTRRSKVDNNVNIGVLGHGLLNLLVDGEESLLSTPVHLGNELTTERVDHTSNRGGLSLADEIKVKHALAGTGLEAVDKGTSLVVEELVGKLKLLRHG